MPRATGEGAPVPASLQHEPASSGNETILLVEDNPSVRRTAVRQLTELGYRVVETENADEARQKIAAGLTFDLLLTDVVMPGGMNGYELAEAVDEVRPGTKVLFTSGYTELAEASRNAPRRSALITKPYSRQSLNRAIRSALGEDDDPNNQLLG